MTLTTSLQITLHSVNSDIKVRSRSYKESIEFLNEIKIPFSEWNGEFNPVNKMYHSFSIFENVSSSERLIYHTDLDEVPDTRSLGRALLELERGECDAGRYQYIFLEYIIWYFYYHDNLCICLWCMYVCIVDQCLGFGETEWVKTEPYRVYNCHRKTHFMTNFHWDVI